MRRPRLRTGSWWMFAVAACGLLGSAIHGIDYLGDGVVQVLGRDEVRSGPEARDAVFAPLPGAAIFFAIGLVLRRRLRKLPRPGVSTPGAGRHPG